jgi:hypothetical protein
VVSLIQFEVKIKVWQEIRNSKGRLKKLLFKILQQDVTKVTQEMKKHDKLDSRGFFIEDKNLYKNMKQKGDF